MKKLLLTLSILLCLALPAQARVLVVETGADTTPPTLSTATIGTNGVTWSFVFSEDVAVGAGGSTGWVVSMSTQGAVALTYSSGSGSNTLNYTGDKTVLSSETVTDGLDYTQPGNGIEDSSGNDLASFVDQVVTNNSTQEAGSCADQSCVGFVVCQNFETPSTGYDNSETWTEVTGDPEAAYTTVHLRGAQSWYGEKTAGVSDIAYKTVSAGYDVYFFFRVQVHTTTNNNIFALREGTAQRFEVNLAGGYFQIQHGTSTVTDNTTAVQIDTIYFVWGHGVGGTGADGTGELYISTTKTKPGSALLSVSNGTWLATDPITRIYIGAGATDTATYFDQVLVKTSDIGSVCE